MTFTDLLKAMNAAVAAHDQTVARLEAALAAHDAAIVAEAAAFALKVAAHQAICDVLAVGDRCTVDEDGTVTIFRTREVTEDAPNGWASYHPALGSES